MTIRAHPPESPGDLVPGILEAIRGCVAGLENAPISNAGIRGIKKWAHEVLRWPAEFPGKRLIDCLSSLYLYIEVGGTGGSAFRRMYARFLEEAAEVAARPSLRKAASSYTGCAEVWREIAVAALPDGIPPLAEIRATLNERNRVMERNAAGSGERARELNVKLGSLAETAAGALEHRRAEALLEDLSARILRLHALETAALGALREAVA